ncbi:hypothetical protein C8A00DRAFT_18169 [Chaetomidium leptoderma]|uniref:Uncharacterized protein n=1 Tax=Chaetomidium leptoderma TaxID=669021 RepID=A0AAN6ZU25_9PEZI|nr:hypothetical protein C8A00DRAFT_18169 [Chaetomidium leptoderma]
MAIGFEKLDKRLDRLDKLFSRKKRAAESDSAVTSNTPTTPSQLSTTFDATIERFPTPSFIRPTSSRMVARDEPLFTPHSARRARSLPESPRTPRLKTSPLLADDGTPTGSFDAPEDCPPIPARYSSLGPGIHDAPRRTPLLYHDTGRDDPSPELQDFSFSTASRESEEEDAPSRRRPRPSSRSLTRPISFSVSPRARVDRKRYSTGAHDKLSGPQQQETDISQDLAQCKSSSLAPLQRENDRLGGTSREYMAPSMLPRPVPLAEPGPDELDNDNSGASQASRNASIPGADIKHTNETLRRLINLPRFRPQNLDPALKEPSLNDFLALSDDDIADGHAAPRAKPSASTPPTFALPPNPSSTSPPRKATQGAYPLLTLSPPLASRPATSAAFEAARIATKYQLDLVYVVNLWPGHMSRPSRSSPVSPLCGTPIATSRARTTTPSPPSSPASNTSRSGDDSGSESRAPAPAPRDTPTTTLRNGSMTGRLLAAYGLPSIRYPFGISAPVHQKVLRTQGWLEYRNGTGARDEFACGYSCAFYTGHSPARGGREAEEGAPDRDKLGKNKLQKPKPANRGLVFAAFRLPREDGTPVCSDAQELEELHQDAEALVDMLIESHMAQRPRRPRPRAAPGRCVVVGRDGGMMKPGAPMVSI